MVPVQQTNALTRKTTSPQQLDFSNDYVWTAPSLDEELDIQKIIKRIEKTKPVQMESQNGRPKFVYVIWNGFTMEASSAVILGGLLRKPAQA